MLFYSICLCLNLLQYCTDNRFLSLCNSNCRKLVKLMNGFNWLFSHHISMLCCSRWPMLLHRVYLNRVSTVKYPVIDLFMNNSNMGLVGESILSWVTTYLFSDQFTFIFKMCCYPMTQFASLLLYHFLLKFSWVKVFIVYHVASYLNLTRFCLVWECIPISISESG